MDWDEINGLLPPFTYTDDGQFIFGPANDDGGFGNDPAPLDYGRVDFTTSNPDEDAPIEFDDAYEDRDFFNNLGNDLPNVLGHGDNEADWSVDNIRKNGTSLPFVTDDTEDPVASFMESVDPALRQFNYGTPTAGSSSSPAASTNAPNYNQARANYQAWSGRAADLPTQQGNFTW